jgi:hypothetical protein
MKGLTRLRHCGEECDNDGSGAMSRETSGLPTHHLPVCGRSDTFDDRSHRRRRVAHRPASSIAIVGVLFFMIGFFTWLNGPLITFVGWPSNSRGRRLPGADGVLPVLFLPRIAASWILKRRHEEGAGLEPGGDGGGGGDVRQFATQRWYPGVGRPVRDRQRPGLLQTAVNPYISILGPIETRHGASR